MSKEELPSIEDLLDKNLPSIEDFVEGENNLPSVENIVENNNLPSVEDIKEDSDLPSMEDYIEEETVTIEDAEGNTFAEVEDVIPPWPELLKIINNVREEIPDIPEIKYYDAELEKLCEIVDEVRSEIPEVKSYDAEVEAICEQIDLVRSTISELPEVKYYDEQIDSIENRINLIKEDIVNLPEPKYYDNDLQSIREEIESFKKNFPWIPWIEESFENVNDSIGTVEEKISLELDSILETVDVKVFENKVLINGIKDNFAEDKQKILADIKESSQKIFDLHNEFKDDDRKLKKQLQGEYNKLKQSVQEQLEKYNQESVKTDELLLKYFTDLKEEISKSPEVKYYDDDIDTLQESVKKSNKRFLPIESDIKSLYKIVEDIKKTQQELNEQKLLEEKQVSEDKDPLTPTDQKFATLDDLSKHYSLFVNRIQQQLSSLGGGGETRLEFLDDVDRDSAKVDGKFLKYDSATGKWVGADASGGGGGGSISGIDTTGTSHFKNLSLTGITTGLNVSGIATVGRLAGFKALVGAESSTTETFVTTVDSKTTNHRYHGSGSSSAYFLDGIESPFLTLLPGKTYRFDQSDSSNSGHPLRFYLEADKTTAYTTNVTTNGTAGSSGAYTEILVTDSTPLVLHYQCSSHGYMGNSSFLNSNLVDTPYQITARSGINVTGIVTATSFVGDLTGDVTGNADTATLATTATTATNAQGLTGTPDVTVNDITARNITGVGMTLTGVLTYEDVTNVDSVGLITARTGINVVAGGINVVGVSTISTGVGTVHVGVGSTALLVEGDARVTGILTIGQGSITLDPNARKIEGIDEIIIGTATTVTIKQDAQGEVKFENKDGKQVSVGIGTTVSINTTGIVTATSFVGNLTGNVTGDVTGTATTATKAVQLKTARTIAGVSFDGTSDISLNNNAITNGAGYITTSFTNTNELTNGAGFISDVADDTTPQLGGNLDLNSKDITGTGSINISGIVTANAFHGDGTNLTGVGGGSVISGITIKEEGSTVGTAGTVVSLNFVGDNITATSSGSGATITASPTPTFDSVSVGIATASTAFYMPQYTTTARDAASFNEGAMIYNTTTKKMEFYDGTSWNSLPGMSLGLTVALDG